MRKLNEHHLNQVIKPNFIREKANELFPPF